MLQLGIELILLFDLLVLLRSTVSLLISDLRIVTLRQLDQFLWLVVVDLADGLEEGLAYFVGDAKAK